MPFALRQPCFSAPMINAYALGCCGVLGLKAGSAPAIMQYRSDQWMGFDNVNMTTCTGEQPTVPAQTACGIQRLKGRTKCFGCPDQALMFQIGTPTTPLKILMIKIYRDGSDFGS